MLGSLLHPNIWTANLLFIGLVQGLIVSLIAMGIVLIYRSSRVINFAVGDLGVPAAAVLAVMVGKSHWPYWPGLLFAVLIGTLIGHGRGDRGDPAAVQGAARDRARRDDRRRRARQAVTHALPDYRTGELQIAYPSPMTAQWTIKSVGLGPFHMHDITVTGPQLLAIIVVPLITLGLWWLLGHTALRRVGARDGDQRRPRAPHRRQPEDHVDRDLDDRRLPVGGLGDPLRDVAGIVGARVDRPRDAAARARRPRSSARMTSFPKAVGGAIGVGLLYQVLVFNFPNETGLVQFVLFIIVLVLVARMSRADDAGGESFAFAPRVPPVPERLREIWWVRRMPQVVAGVALARRDRRCR